MVGKEKRFLRWRNGDQTGNMMPTRFVMRSGRLFLKMVKSTESATVTKRKVRRRKGFGGEGI
jgi:hypothetical protein